MSSRPQNRKRKTLRRRRASLPWPTTHFSDALDPRWRRLSIESLEDRRVLSGLTITVNTNNDTHAANDATSDLDANGNVSLRSAVEYLNATTTANATVNFANSIGGTIDITLGQLEIAESMNIEGPGASSLTIAENSNLGQRVVQVDATNANSNPITVTMSGLTVSAVQNIFSGHPGGIENDGTLTLSSVSLSGIPTTSGIYNTGTLTVSNSTISGNSNQGGGMTGGGIDNTGTLTVSDSTISGNAANFGAGIYNSGNMVVTESTISGNSVASGSGAGIYSSSGNVILSGSTVSGNQKGTEFVNAGGGGIYHSGGTFTIVNSTVSDNFAPTDSSDGGGGIENTGGVLTVTESTISGNTVFNGQGGGIFAAGGTVAIANTIIAGNAFTNGGSERDVMGTFSTTTHNLIGIVGDATGFSGNGNIIEGTDDTSTLGLGALADNGGPTKTIALLAGSPAIGAGGALATLQGSLNSIDAGTSTVAVSDATFFAVGEPLYIDQEIVTVTAVDSNANTITISRAQDGTVEAVHASGAPIYPALDQRGFARQTKDIGAFGSQASLVVTSLADTHTDGYTTLREAVAEANAIAGGIAIGFAPSLFVSGPATINLTQGQLEIAETMTIDGPGAGLLKINQSDPSPRGVFLVDATDSNANRIDVSISSLTISGGRNQGTGGGIDNLGALTLDAVVVSGNAAATEGGGIYNAGNLTVTNSTISGNSSNPGGGGKGGGIYNDGGTATLTNVVLSGNSASFEGAIATSGTFTVTDSTITNNDSTNGSNLANSGTLTVNASTISNNSTESGNGGGISNNGNVTVVDSTISDNSATTGHGGGLYNTGTATVIDSTISGNSGYSSGGGIDNSGALTLFNTTLSANSTGGLRTGGALNNTGTATITDTTISENTATHGGGIFNASGAVINIANTIVAGNSFTSGGSDPDVDGSFTITSHDLIGLVGDASGFSGNGNIVGTTTAIDPLLGPLADNGGLTQTMALLGGSPAIGNGGALATTQIGLNATDTSDVVAVRDTTFFAVGEALSIGQEIVVVTAVDPQSNTITVSRGQDGSTETTHASGDSIHLAFDQRGLPRVVNGAVDIGAFQTQSGGQTIGSSLSDFKATAGGVYTVELVPGSAPPQVEIVGSAGKVLVQAGISSISSIAVTNTSGQPVQLVVDSANGAISVPVKFDGGAGAGSSLVLQGGAATSDTYSPGPGGGQGTDTLVIGGVTQTVSFVNLTPVYDSVAGDLTVNGTNGDDAISYVEGDDTTGAANTAWGQVAVNNLEVINFTSKGTLTISTGLGTDTVDLNNPNTPAGPTAGSLLTGINVNGSDPAGNVTLTAHTVPGVANAMIVTPTGSGSGTLTNNYQPQPAVSFTDTADLNVVARSADNNQQLVYTGTAGDDTYEFTPGATGDAGKVVGSESGAAGFAFVPLSFSGFNDTGGNTATLTLGSGFGAGTPGGTDAAIIDGTPADDVFNFTDSTSYPGSIAVIAVTNGVPHTEVSVDPTMGLSNIVLRGLGANDVVNATMPTGQPDVLLSIQGNGPSGGATTLNYTAPAGALTTVDLAADTINAAGANPISFTGLTSLKLDANGGAVTVLGTSQDDSFTYTPEAADEGLIQLASSSTHIDVSDLKGAMLLIDPAGGNSSVAVNDTAGSNTVNTALGDTTTVSADFLLPVSVVAADTGSLALNSVASPQFVFSGSGGPSNINISSAGGSSMVLPPHGGSYIIAPGFVATAGNVFRTVGLDGVLIDGGGAATHMQVLGAGFNVSITGTNRGDVNVAGGFDVLFSDLGAGNNSLVLSASAAGESFQINQVSQGGFGSVFIQSPAGGSLLLSAGGSGGIDAFSYTPLGPQNAHVDLTTDGATNHYILSGVDNLQLNEIGQTTASLAVNNANAVITPAITPNSGTVTTTDVNNATALLPLTYTNIATVTASGAAAVIDAPDDGDKVAVSATGVVTVTNKLGVTNTIDASGYTSLAIDLLGADDTLTFQKGSSALWTGGVTVVGGPSDMVQLTGDGSAMTVSLSGAGLEQTTITGGGFASLAIDGLTNVHVDANGGAVNVVGTSLNNAFAYTPEAADEGLIQLTSSSTQLDVADLQGAPLTIDPGSGTTSISVNGAAEFDDFNTMLGDTTTVTVGSLLPVGIVAAHTTSLVLSGPTTFAFNFSGSGGPKIDVAGSGGSEIFLPPAGGSYNIGPRGAVGTGLVQNTGIEVNFTGVDELIVDGAGTAVNLSVAGAGFNLQSGGSDSGFVNITNGFTLVFNDVGPGNNFLTLNGGSAGDVIMQQGVWNFGTVIISDRGGGGVVTLDAKGSGGADAFSYSATGPQNAVVNLTSGGTTNSYQLKGVGTLDLAEVGTASASLNVTNANAIITPGILAGDGTVTTTEVNGAIALVPISYTNIATVTASGTSAVIDVPDDGDKVAVSPAGVVTITNKLGVTNTIDASGYASLAVDLLGADDTVTFQGDNPLLFTGGMTVVGGAGGYSVAAPISGAGRLDMASDSISGIFGGNVTLNGAAKLTLNGDGATTAMTVSNYGAPSTLAGVTLNADATIAVTTGGTANTFDFTSLGPTAATLALASGGPALSITGFDLIPGGLLLASAGGPNALVVTGSSGDDQFRLSQAGIGTRLTQTTSGTASVGINFTGFSSLAIDGGAGNDTLTVDSTNGVVATPIAFDGGAGNNALSLVDTANTAASDVYSPGPGAGQGSETLNFGTAANPAIESVQFINLTPVYDSVSGPLTVNGTSSNDAISYTEGNDTTGAANAAWGQVTVNHLEALNFADKTSLTINTGLGTDTVSLNDPNTPTRLTGITINGGDPAAGDKLTVNGTASQDLIDFAPTSATEAVLTGAGPVPISATGIGQTIVNGNGGNDELTVTAPSGGSEMSFTPANSPDAGSVTMHSFPSRELMPLRFSGLGNAGGLVFADASGNATDLVDVYGTDSANEFNVLPDGSLNVLDPTFFVPLTPTINTPGAAVLRLVGQGGNNVFNIPGTFSRTEVLDVQGAPAGSNTANLTGDGTAPVTVDLAAGTVVESGFTPVTLSGIGALNVNALGAAVTAVDSSSNNTLNVTPTATNTSTVQIAGQTQVVNTTSGGNLSVTLATNDALVVNGSQYDDTMNVSGTQVTDQETSGPGTTLQTVAFAGAASLAVNGNAGSDTFNVTPSVLPISIDGGDPVGVLPGDTLNIAAGGGPARFFAGPTTDSGGFVVGGNQPVSFTHVETLGSVAVTGTVLVQGTNANDDIQITATGHQSFTVSVNGGLSVPFVNVPALYIDTLAGADQVNVTGPAAGSAYNWNEKIFLAGVSHAADSNNIDRLTLETPRVGVLTYTPTAAETGVLVYDQGGGNTSTITSGAFQFAAANYNSSPGGIEQLAINGESAGGTLNVVTPAGPDTIVYNPGATSDAAAVAVGSFLPLSFTNLGPSGTVSLADASGGRVDDLLFNGTAANDSFAVAASGLLSLNSQLAVSTPGVNNLALNGLAASDTFTLNATMPYTNLAVNGGNTAKNDAVVLKGATGAIAVNLANQSAAPPTLTTITGYGGTVSLANIAQASLNGSGADTLTLNGTSNDDQINYQPTSASGGNFSLAGLDTAFSFNIGGTPANTFVIFGGGSSGGDQVNVRGPNAGSTFVVVEQTGVVTVSNAAGTNLMPVTLGTNVQTVELDAGVGNNTFLVDPAPGLLLPGKTDVVGQPNFQVPNNLLVNVVGGGAAAQNALIVAAYNPTNGQSSTLDASLFAVVNRTSNTYGVVRVFHSNGAAPANEPNQFPDISYAGVVTVSADTATDAATQQQQTLTLGPDVYDPNGSLNNAAYLGSGATINAANLVIFPNVLEHKFLQAEQDWFRVVAQSTGTMDFQVYFNQYAGFLPGNGELQIQAYDSAGHVISDFGANDQTSDQRRRIPVVAGETYYLQVYGVSQDATRFPQNAAAPDLFDPNNATVNGYSLSIVNTPAPAPDSLGLNNLAAQGPNSPTRDNRPTIYIRLDAANTPGDGLIDLNGGGTTGQTPPDNVPIPIPFWAGDAPAAPNSPANTGSFRVAVYDVTAAHAPVLLGYADAVAGETGVFQLPLAAPLADGTHNLVAKVEMDSAGTPSNHDVGSGTSLQAVIDTQAPSVFFGSPTAPDSGLAAASDSGVAGQPATSADRVTADSSPTFFGDAEANAVVRLYVGTPSGNVLIGQATATPNAGAAPNSSAEWTIASTTDLNDPSLGLPHDGARNLFVTAEDAAGNVSAPQELTIFIDTQGPQLAGVSITRSPAYKLFDAILGQPTPTPLANSLDVTFTDQPARVGPDFIDPAVNPALAATIGNYQLVGQRSGSVQITSITLADSTTAGSTGETVATLHFAAPLADDAYTLSISDKIEDNAGNALDGEFNGGAFPSGNSNPGGAFSGAFIINSHPHLAVYGGGSVALDINGNGVFDPSNTLTDSDVIENFGYASDRLIAGNFASTGGTVSGFDELGAYGFVNNQWRWLLNLDPAAGTNKSTTFVEPLAIDGTPVAGYFAGDPSLGMQVGLFDGKTWYLDVLNHHTIDAADLAAGGKLSGDMRGDPIVGDFDGDGKTDLATYQNGVFYFDLSSQSAGGKLTGNYNATLNAQSDIPNNIGYSPLLAQPVAADIDQDGITDIGLYVPGSSGTAPNGQSEWYWLVSNDSQDAHGVNPASAFAALNHVFNPTPLGHDLQDRFGSQFAAPLVGIWHPPTTSSTTITQTSPDVTRLYETVLGRQPTAAESIAWNNVLATTQISPQQLALDFLESDERLSTIINGLYQQFLGRQADPLGLSYWTDVMRTTGSDERVQVGIISSPEYYATAGRQHPNLSPDAAWVTALYNNLLDRVPDAQGLSYWVHYIQTQPRASVVLGFITSDEYRSGLIAGWYEQYLARPADPASSAYWLVQMEHGATQDQVVTAILSSAEFISRSQAAIA